MEALRVNGRYLATESGKPFFYLADTAWEILHGMSREELAEYFLIRAEQGFTCVQTVLLAELDGLRTPNFYGRLPLHKISGVSPDEDYSFDPASPDVDGDYSYWAHVDYAVKEAEKRGLYLVLLPTWGDKFNRLWGKGPVIFTEDNAYAYGRFLGQRYGSMPNVIWMLGGDRPLEAAHRKIVDAMAAGIRSADHAHLITFHPTGSRRSTEYVGDADYIDFHSAQTGHDTRQCLISDQVILQMQKDTDKPCLDSEPRYEDHPACFNDRLGVFWGETEVRQNAYWDVLSGACGHTYGNHSVWSMTRQPGSYFRYTYKDVLRHPGAEQMKYVKQLRLSRDYFSFRSDSGVLSMNYPGEGHMVSGRGNGYIYIYCPLGLPFSVNAGLFPQAVHMKASWFDPRNGVETLFTILDPNASHMFVPESQGRGHDWVLILETCE